MNSSFLAKSPLDFVFISTVVKSNSSGFLRVYCWWTWSVDHERRIGSTWDNGVGLRRRRALPPLLYREAGPAWTAWWYPNGFRWFPTTSVGVGAVWGQLRPTSIAAIKMEHLNQLPGNFDWNPANGTQILNSQGAGYGMIAGWFSFETALKQDPHITILAGHTST